MRMLVTVCLAISSATAVPQIAKMTGLNALTVPEDRLPEGCRLKLPPPAPAGGRGSRVVSAQPPPFSANPWLGTDRRPVATIRQILEGPPRVPDGPPLDQRQAARYFLRFADGIVDAYRATYQWSDESDVDVYAVRFEGEDLVRELPRERASSRGGVTSRVVIGPAVALVSARGGVNRCFEAVRAYIQSLQ